MKHLALVLTCTLALLAPLSAADIPTQENNSPKTSQTQTLDLKKVFSSSPMIYSLLLLMSTSSVALWLYTLATFRPKELMPQSFLAELTKTLNERKFQEAADLCATTPNLLSSIISAGLSLRNHGSQVMTDTMKSEGKRSTAALWQRLSLLNDIAVVAPMIGLLGTVVGMFYAFYDINRSIESINALFDGIGIAVGTTVAGLIVAIVSMVFSTTLKYRIMKNLTLVEQEAMLLSSRIECTKQ